MLDNFQGLQNLNLTLEEAVKSKHYQFMLDLQLANMGQYYSKENPINPLVFYYSCDSSKNYVIKSNGALIGFIRLNAIDAKSWHLSDIQLSEKYQGLGVGTWLMLSIEESAKEAGIEKLSLYVFKKNNRAEKFYILHGFTQNLFEKPQTEEQKVYIKILK